MARASVVGTGMTDFGVYTKPIAELFADAALPAIDDAGIANDEIDAFYFGNVLGGATTNETHLAPQVASYIGLTPETSVQRYEDACATGSLALKHGVRAVETGDHDVVLVGGAEQCTPKGTGIETSEMTRIFGSGAHKQYEQAPGMTTASVFALHTQRHMHEYGTTEKHLAEVAVKNHYHGSMNSRAQFSEEKTVEEVLDSPIIASPFRLLDCCPFSDGASAVVIVSEDAAESYGVDPIDITGISHQANPVPVADQPNPPSTDMVRRAAQNVYEQADIGPNDVDVAEIHDCFTGAEILALEALGLFEDGQAGPATTEGRTRLDGEMPINPSGGLKAKGHPIGATGTAQIVELTEQLKGESGDRQVEDAKQAIAHNVGGMTATAVVTAMEARA
ncbi:thiolase family protein [Natronococcus pandeyae]|nr:thiolase family protein [Natronococcus pandeyae]